jgi:hypothetical protein
MTTAIFGLVGVVVGALVTGVVSWLLERRKEKAEAVAAARLLKPEVTAAVADVTSTLDEGRWPIAYRPMWRESWATYRQALVVAMQQRGFDEVATAYARMAQLQSAFSADRAEKDRDLSYSDTDFLQKTKPALESAKQQLENFLADRPA